MVRGFFQGIRKTLTGKKPSESSAAPETVGPGPQAPRHGLGTKLDAGLGAGAGPGGTRLDRRAASSKDLKTLPVDTETAPSSDDHDALGDNLIPHFDSGALERYSDEGEIGRGGMGRVHRVLDKTLLREVALKLLRPELEEQARQVRRFVREAQITAQLDHPNIVPIHEIGRDPETGYYIGMKLVDGDNLGEVIEKLGEERLEPEKLAELLQIFIKICEAISFAHSRGVVHRDLKPSNIMVGKFGQVYVMDWGVARLLPEPAEAPSRYTLVAKELEEALEEQPGNIIGTPRYMPPEQVQGRHERVDERSDVFALGATLYHMLTGRPPYASDTYYNTLLEALAAEIPPPEDVVGEDRIPPGLSAITMKALAADIGDRYPSVPELQHDLERFLRGSWDQVIETFPPGARIISEGEEGDVAYIILEGRCSVFTVADGQKIVLREMGPGEVFAETGIIAATPRTASVEAIDEVKVKVVSRETLTHGLGLNSWMGAFVRALADRFRDVDERLRRHELESSRDGLAK